MDKIEGKKGQKLPWERNPMKPRLAQKLGMFRKLVLALLNRDPSKRPPMKTFCTACTRVLSRSDSMHVLDAFAPETTATPNAVCLQTPFSHASSQFQPYSDNYHQFALSQAPNIHTAWVKVPTTQGEHRQFLHNRTRANTSSHIFSGLCLHAVLKLQ